MVNDRDLMVSLGANIKALRLSKHLQQKDVASKAGISTGQYGRVENGTTNASVLIIAKIAQVLDVDVDTLIFGESVDSESEPLVLKDKMLIEKLKELDALDEQDKEIAHQLLDLILTQKKLKELTDTYQVLSGKV